MLARTGHTATVAGRFLVVAGGITRDSSPHTHVLLVDLQQMRFVQWVPMPACHCAVVMPVRARSLCRPLVLACMQDCNSASCISVAAGLDRHQN